jgi:hypothetical protein
VTEERDSLCDRNIQAASADGSLPKKSTKFGGSCVGEGRLEVMAGEELFEKIDVHGGELASVEDLIEDSDCELVEDNEARRVADSVVDPEADDEVPAADTDELRADTEEHLAEADQKADEEEKYHQNGQQQAAEEKDMEDTEHGPSCDCLDCDDADFLHGFVDGEPWGIK